jgi:hypothetical protein
MLSDRESAVECDTKNFNGLEAWHNRRWDFHGLFGPRCHKSDLHRFDLIQFGIVLSHSVFYMCNLNSTRPDIGSWYDEIRIISKFHHEVSRTDRMEVRCCHNVGIGPNARSLSYACKNKFELENLATAAGTVRIFPEKNFDPVVEIIRQVHPGEFNGDCTMTYTIKCFGEVQGIYYDWRVSGKVGSDCVQHSYEIAAVKPVGWEANWS